MIIWTYINSSFLIYFCEKITTKHVPGAL
uniref:Uncharacterized protein n=1 Tax=Arundo donax TaxID=35708 RepID=A0A0A8ZWS5_ARUDO